VATGPTFADAAPTARALIAAAPDRLIWGSDYPHLSFADKVGSVQLFNLLADWAARRSDEAADPGRQSRRAVRLLTLMEADATLTRRRTSILEACPREFQLVDLRRFGKQVAGLGSAATLLNLRR
jgi:hypothetical protein